MQDLEIYARAAEILEDVKQDFNRAYYEKIGGNLEVLWSDKDEFNAYASTCSNINQAPIHKITLTYKLAKEIYRDGEKFYDFLAGPINNYKQYFSLYDNPNPPDQFSYLDKNAFLNNFFAASLTFVFAHEIGHLTQEHGHIRIKYGCENNSNDNLVDIDASVDGSFSSINEAEAVGSNKSLTPRQSLIWHVTELAADYEATFWCVVELFRHTGDVPENERSDIFMEYAFIFIASITCIHFRFNGLKAKEPPTVPTGSHPHPIFRIEKSVTQAIETIDAFKSVLRIKQSKRDLVHYFHRASTAANLFGYRSFVIQKL